MSSVQSALGLCVPHAYDALLHMQPEQYREIARISDVLFGQRNGEQGNEEGKQLHKEEGRKE